VVFLGERSPGGETREVSRKSSEGEEEKEGDLVRGLREREEKVSQDENGAPRRTSTS